jgi:hypothetical protein
MYADDRDKNSQLDEPNLEDFEDLW